MRLHRHASNIILDRDRPPFMPVGNDITINHWFFDCWDIFSFLGWRRAEEDVQPMIIRANSVQWCTCHGCQVTGAEFSSGSHTDKDSCSMRHVIRKLIPMDPWEGNGCMDQRELGQRNVSRRPLFLYSQKAHNRKIFLHPYTSSFSCNCAHAGREVLLYDGSLRLRRIEIVALSDLNWFSGSWLPRRGSSLSATWTSRPRPRSCPPWWTPPQRCARERPGPSPWWPAGVLLKDASFVTSKLHSFLGRLETMGCVIISLASQMW